MTRPADLISILKPKRSWFQFRLRTVFVLVVVVALPCVWLAWKRDAKRRERANIAAIEQLGGSCDYRWEAEGHSPPGPEWLRKLLGEDFFADVDSVSLDRLDDADTAMTYVRDMTHLTLLWLNYSQLTDEGLSNVEGLNGLQELTLNGSQITDNGLKSLEGHTSLEALYLEDTQVSDIGLTYLEGLTRLKELVLDNTHVTDAGLKHPAKLTSLKSLSLSHTPITNSGLKHLYGLIGLEEVHIYGTQVTDTGIDDLQEALPNCRIYR